MGGEVFFIYFLFFIPKLRNSASASNFLACISKTRGANGGMFDLEYSYLGSRVELGDYYFEGKIFNQSFYFSGEDPRKSLTVP